MMEFRHSTHRKCVSNGYGNRDFIVGQTIDHFFLKFSLKEKESSKWFTFDN